ncbi:unnamed protein product [Caenorhabditis auriculariae]|uniref:Uncharacterized protein n=1 Tax=Caenorhabditis auriculariae TaxID=2777116 RepID=A0A8S1H9Q6_9PELO|nr:unnamed protein product [Caenorhabditis auriculariae]
MMMGDDLDEASRRLSFVFFALNSMIFNGKASRIRVGRFAVAEIRSATLRCRSMQLKFDANRRLTSLDGGHCDSRLFDQYRQAARALDPPELREKIRQKRLLFHAESPSLSATGSGTTNVCQAPLASSQSLAVAVQNFLEALGFIFMLRYALDCRPKDPDLSVHQRVNAERLQCPLVQRLARAGLYEFKTSKPFSTTVLSFDRACAANHIVLYMKGPSSNTYTTRCSTLTLPASTSLRYEREARSENVGYEESTYSTGKFSFVWTHVNLLLEVSL